MLETIEVMRLRAFFRHDPHAHTPFRETSFLDGVKEIALRVVRIGVFQRADCSRTIGPLCCAGGLSHALITRFSRTCGPDPLQAVPKAHFVHSSGPCLL